MWILFIWDIFFNQEVSRAFASRFDMFKETSTLFSFLEPGKHSRREKEWYVCAQWKISLDEIVEVVFCREKLGFELLYFQPLVNTVTCPFSFPLLAVLLLLLTPQWELTLHPQPGCSVHLHAPFGPPAGGATATGSHHSENLRFFEANFSPEPLCSLASDSLAPSLIPWSS